MKRAFITGITGQDGSYLAEYLLDKGYNVHGLVRRVALEDPLHRMGRINHIKEKITFHPGDISSYSRLHDIFDQVKPDECYHLAAQSFVYESFEDESTIRNVNSIGTENVLRALKKRSPETKFYFAGSSEMFGKAEEIPQKETTNFHPRSPYGISKVDGFHYTRLYREGYKIFACNGILFNHESPRRGFEFVTRKITSNIARMKKGIDNVLLLGNLKAKRDWGFAGDYIRAMHSMLQKDIPDDYVIATGKTHSIKEFLDLASQKVNLNYNLIDFHELSSEKANNEIYKLRKEKKECFVVQHPEFYRPAEVDFLMGNASKAKKELGWEPKISFEELVDMMIENDMKITKQNNQIY